MPSKSDLGMTHAAFYRVAVWLADHRGSRAWAFTLWWPLRRWSVFIVKSDQRYDSVPAEERPWHQNVLQPVELEKYDGSGLQKYHTEQIDDLHRRLQMEQVENHRLRGTLKWMLNNPQASEPEVRCASGQDGDCTWEFCPQLRDGEPMKSGRHCPFDKPDEDY